MRGLKITVKIMPKELFESPWSEESRVLVIVKKAIWVFVAVNFVFAVMSGFRIMLTVFFIGLFVFNNAKCSHQYGLVSYLIL